MRVGCARQPCATRRAGTAEGRARANAHTPLIHFFFHVLYRPFCVGRTHDTPPYYTSTRLPACTNFKIKVPIPLAASTAALKSGSVLTKKCLYRTENGSTLSTTTSAINPLSNLYYNDHIVSVRATELKGLMPTALPIRVAHER